MRKYLAVPLLVCAGLLHAQSGMLTITSGGVPVGDIPAERDTNQNLSINTTLPALTPNPGSYLGISNICIGNADCLDLTTGSYNYVLGNGALQTVTSGFANVGIGDNIFGVLTTGSGNVAVGDAVLSYLTTGFSNSCMGASACENTTTARFNSALGDSALANNITGDDNTAVGQGALNVNSTGSYNSALGQYSLQDTTSGSYNTGVGQEACGGVSTGSHNTCIGTNAEPNAVGDSYETCIGDGCNGHGSHTVTLGTAAEPVYIPNVPNAPFISTDYNGRAFNAAGGTSPNPYSGTSTQTIYNFYTFPLTGKYLVCAPLRITAAGSGGGTWTIQVASSDNGINSFMGNSVPIAAINANNSGSSSSGTPNCIVAYEDAAATLSLQIIPAGTFATPPTLVYGASVLYMGP